MRIFELSLVYAAQLRGRVLERHGLQPQGVQQRILQKLLRRARNTAFGREHGFGDIRDVRDFRRQVPLRDYAGLEPWLTRALRGERDVVWPGKIPYFGMSSGTTAGNKYLPITLDSVAQQRRGGFDPVAAHLRAGGSPDLLSGAAILLGSTTTLEKCAHGIMVGDNTGIMARHVPSLLRRRQLPSRRVQGIPTWDERIRALAEEAVGRDVRLIAGTPAWFTGLFDAVLAVARERGSRATHISEIWPRLRLLTGGGVRYAPYRPLIEARLGMRVPYLDVYNATEGGIMGVQDSREDTAMRLLPDANVFYEFVPLAELGSREPRRLSMWEVEAGQVYALALSTVSGLFGYLLGDCLRFTSVFPHRFVFEGRTAAFLNVCGEHVSQAELERAVAHACVDNGATLAEFTVGPEVSAHGSVRHVYYVECDGHKPDSARLAEAIDRKLGHGNEDYRVHRSSTLSLAPPTVVLLPRGTFERFMRARGKLGGQHKVPRVIEDPQLLHLLARPAPTGESAQADAASIH